MPIGQRTSDNWVQVRQKCLSRCAAASPYLAGFLTVPASSAYRPRRTGDNGDYDVPGRTHRGQPDCNAIVV